MLLAKNSQAQWCLAKEMIGQPRQAYFCPSCHEAVILKCGSKLIPHFAHRSLAKCQSFSEGESYEHLLGKLLLFDFLSSQSSPKLEAYLPELQQRPDILWGKRAVEVQCSKISFAIFWQRTRGYCQAGYQPLWLLGKQLHPKAQFTKFHKACSVPQNNLPGKLYLLDSLQRSLLVLDRFSWHYRQGMSYRKRVYQITAKNLQLASIDPEKDYRWEIKDYRSSLERALVYKVPKILRLQGQFYQLKSSISLLPSWCYAPSHFSFYFEHRLLLLRYYYLLYAASGWHSWLKALKALTWQWEFPLVDQGDVLRGVFEECHQLAKKRIHS